VTAERVVIYGVVSGSVLVSFGVLPHADGTALSPGVLLGAFSAPAVPLPLVGANTTSVLSSLSTTAPPSNAGPAVVPGGEDGDGMGWAGLLLLGGAVVRCSSSSSSRPSITSLPVAAAAAAAIAAATAAAAAQWMTGCSACVGWVESGGCRAAGGGLADVQDKAQQAPGRPAASTTANPAARERSAQCTVLGAIAPRSSAAVVLLLLRVLPLFSPPACADQAADGGGYASSSSSRSRSTAYEAATAAARASA
jgi:hypothetical protein